MTMFNIKLLLQTSDQQAQTNVVVTDHGTGAVTADQPVFTSKNVGTLTAGQSTTIDYGGTVTVPSGTIINTAYVNATGLPQLSASADITVSKAVITPPPVVTGTPALSITKQVEDLTTHGAYAASITANQNDQVQYQVVVTNTGSANATNVVVTDHGNWRCYFKCSWFYFKNNWERSQLVQVQLLITVGK